MTNSEKEKKFRLVFPGSILPGTDEDEVVRNLARLLGTSSEKAQRLIAGKRRYIKRVFSYKKAFRVRIQILKIGVECELVAVDPSNLSSKPKKKNIHNVPFPEPEGSALMGGDGEAKAVHGPSYGETMAELQEYKEKNDYQGVESDELEQHDVETEKLKAEQSGATVSRLHRMAQFVAENLDDYLPRFEKFQQNGHSHFSFTWHWPAFFVPFFWAIYRKLWVWAIVIFISSVFWPFTNIVWALTANYIYYMHCQRKLKNFRKRFSSDQIDEKISEAGGTSSMALFAAILALLIMMNGVYWTAKLSPVFSELNTNLEKIEQN